MSVERILIVFKPDMSIKGIASYAENGAAEEMSAETAAALLPHAALLAQIQALQAENESLAAQVRAGAAGAPPAAAERAIHKAWLRAALASIERLAEVDAAVKAAGAVHWELWANATTISRDDADVVAIAEALKIDLDAVFAAARAIQAARGG